MEKTNSKFNMIPNNDINYNSVTEIRSLLENEGLGIQKKYGQHFLINSKIREKLINELDAEKGATVWEIGPGLGAMTKLLLDRGLLVRTFEIDPGFCRILHSFFDKYPNFSMIQGDVLKTYQNQPVSSMLFGNLPYNIAAIFIGELIENRVFFERMVITVQHEVAQRMTAKPGSDNYSSFSILCSSVYSIKKVMTIKPGAFYPSPNVNSMGLKLEIRTDYMEYPVLFYPLVRQLFMYRRKMIKNNIIKFIGSGMSKNCISLDDISQSILGENNLTGKERAENLDIGVIVGLAKTIENMGILR